MNRDGKHKATNSELGCAMTPIHNASGKTDTIETVVDAPTETGQIYKKADDQFKEYSEPENGRNKKEVSIFTENKTAIQNTLLKSINNLYSSELDGVPSLPDCDTLGDSQQTYAVHTRLDSLIKTGEIYKTINEHNEIWRHQSELSETGATKYAGSKDGQKESSPETESNAISGSRWWDENNVAHT